MDDESGGRNDFLGIERADGRLRSFSAAPGGYVGFFDPVVGDHQTWSHPGDMLAAQRMIAKRAAGLGRRALRYGELKPKGAWRKMATGIRGVRRTDKDLLLPAGSSQKSQNGGTRSKTSLEKKPQKRKTQKTR